MADSSSTIRVFYGIVKALEDENYKRATELTKKNIKKLVHSIDRRDEENVEEHFHYKYRLFERKGLTLLHYAALYDQPEMVKILLQHKADPLKEEEGRAKNNPFHFACMFGGEHTIGAFLSSSKHEELINQGNSFTWKPLFYISERDEPELMKLLINKGADPNGVSEETADSVLQFATKYSSPDSVNELLNCGQRIEVDYKNRKTGQTALHMACEDDNITVVKLLVNKGADIDILDDKNRTALQVAICKSAENSAKLLMEKSKLTRKNGIKLLIEATERPKIFLNILNLYTKKFGRYSINLKHGAQEHRDVAHKIVRSEAYSEEEFTEAVTKLGKNCIEDVDTDGRTPIMVAAMLNKHKKLAILLDVYTKILTECLYTPDKFRYSNLYEDLMAKQDEKGFAAIHLAIMCDGPDVDFEGTLKELNSLRYNGRVGRHQKTNPLLLQVNIDPGKPHQPCEFKYPKRSFGQKAPVSISFQPAWYKKWPFLHYDESQDAVLCYTCQKAFHQKKLMRSDLDSAFVTRGFYNWKHATASFKKHKLTPCHRKAVEVITTRNFGLDGKTAMHLAIEKGKPERVLVLLRKTGGEGIHLQDMNSSNVIHCAIEHKMRPAVFKQMLHLSKDSMSTLRIALKTDRKSKGTVLQMALMTHQFIQAKHLLDLNTLTSRKALDRRRSLSTNNAGAPEDEIDGDEQIVDTNVKDNKGNNTLYVAIENRSPIDLIEQLLKNGSKPSDDETQRLSIYTDEHTQLSTFKAILDCCVREGGLEIEKEHGATLLKTAVDEKNAEVAKFLLAKGAGIEFDTSILRDVIKKEDREFAWLIVRYTKSVKHLIAQLRGIAVMENSRSGEVLYHELIKKMPDVAEEALNRSILLENGEIFYHYTNSLLLNEWKKEADDKFARRSEVPSSSTLDCMVEHEVKLLQHPGVKHVLREKWQGLGLPLYLLQLILYCFLVIPLSILVLLPYIFSEISDGYTTASYVMAGVVLVASFIHLLFHTMMIACQQCHKKRNVYKVFFPIFKQFHIYLQMMTFTLAFVFSGLTIVNTATNGSYDGITWHFGLFAIVLGWTSLVHLCSKLPFVGEQAITFLEIVWTFLKLTLFALLLVLAATIILSMTFFNGQAFHSPFFTFRRGIVTVTTMITGELDYSDAFGLSYDSNNDTAGGPSLLYPETANMVWVIFLIFIPILLSNMLTGLAVGDIIEIRRNASLRKLKHQVELVESAERCCGSKKFGCMKNFYFVYRKLEKLVIDEDSDEENLVKEKLLSYNKKREAEVKEMTEKGHFPNDNRIAESIEDVKEVALSCEKKIKEFKDAHDDTVKKIKEETDNIRREVEKLVDKLASSSVATMH